MSEYSFQTERKGVLDRDNYECQFCGVSDDQHRAEHGRGLDVHHIVPRRADGGNDPSNLISVCRGCHKRLEHTQAEAVNRLHEQIKEMFDKKEKPDESEKVVVDERWEHDDHGTVRIVDLDSEMVGYNNGEPDWKIIVVFQVYNEREDPHVDKFDEFREPYTLFKERGHREAHNYETGDNL